jgi:hypothetical protein
MHILDLELTWEESEPRTPLVCILSTGSDPTNQIIALAKLKNIRKPTWKFLDEQARPDASSHADGALGRALLCSMRKLTELNVIASFSLLFQLSKRSRWVKVRSITPVR